MLFREPQKYPLGTCFEECLMFRSILIAMTFAVVGVLTTGAAFADDDHGHHRGYSGGHYHHHHGNSGYFRLSYGNPYGYGYYARPVYPAYGYGYYPAYPAYRPYYGGCGGHGYPVYGGYGGGISFGFGW